MRTLTYSKKLYINSCLIARSAFLVFSKALLFLYSKNQNKGAALHTVFLQRVCASLEGHLELRRSPLTEQLIEHKLIAKA